MLDNIDNVLISVCSMVSASSIAAFSFKELKISTVVVTCSILILIPTTVSQCYLLSRILT
jgi:hypothetical protein